MVKEADWHWETRGSCALSVLENHFMPYHLTPFYHTPLFAMVEIRVTEHFAYCFKFLDERWGYKSIKQKNEQINNIGIEIKERNEQIIYCTYMNIMH